MVQRGFFIIFAIPLHLSVAQVERNRCGRPIRFLNCAKPKMKRTAFLYIILLTLGLGELYAQIPKDCDCFIQGIVQDDITKQPIVGAVVFIKELNKGVSTDAKGFYRISNICQGKYTVIGRIVGYEEKKYTISLEHGAEQNIKLSETELHLANIDIKAQKIENLTQNKTSLENAALDQTRGQSLGEALKQISGVTTLQTGSSIAKPVIHGMHSNRVLIMNNGVRQEGQQWGSEHAPEIDPFVAKKITVLKGAAGVRLRLRCDCGRNHARTRCPTRLNNHRWRNK